MLKNKKKNDSNSSISRPINRMLRLLRIDHDFTTSNVGLMEKGNRNDHENISEYYRKEIRNEVLQTEYWNGQAMLAIRNRTLSS